MGRELYDNEVSIADGESRVVLVPARGGIAARFEVGERAVFYLDEATLIDPSKNVRGGNPVLFPSPGPLVDGKFAFAGRTGAMKQHGFARDRPWRVVSHDARSATLELAADEITRAQFPWECHLTFRYSLRNTTLRIEQRCENRDDTPMPFAAGFHPYFHVRDADKAHATIPTKAARAWNNVTKQLVELAGIDLSQQEVDLHLVDHNESSAELRLPEGRIVVSASPEFTRWVIWTLAGKDFVCLEPWTAPANALNDGASLLVVAPGESRELWTEILWTQSHTG